MSVRRTGIRVWVVAAGLTMTASAACEEPPSATPSPKAVEALQRVESTDPYQQQLGFLRLEALREVSAVPLIQPYVTHRDPDMRAYALRALAAIEGAQAVPLLLESLRTEKQPRVRREALLGLEPLQQGDPNILPAFIRALRDKNTEVRMAAVDVVSRIDDPRAREAILLRNKRERRRDVRRVLSLAMRRLGQP
jgi:HEAT repeat protein